jgi:hypothetical protein
MDKVQNRSNPLRYAPSLEQFRIYVLIFWDIALCSPYVNRRFGENISIFRAAGQSVGIGRSRTKAMEFSFSPLV